MDVSKKQARRQGIERQIRRLDAQLVQLRQDSSRLSWVRLLVFFAGLGLSGVVWYGWGLRPAGLALLLTLICFGVAVYFHRRVNLTIDRFTAWQRHKQAQLARMALNWPAMPGLSHARPGYEHPFEADLDLVGEVSLHRLLDTAVTLEGSRLLRQWLTEPTPALADIERRQALVRELTRRSLFRDKLILNAVVATGTRKMWQAGRLTGWLTQVNAGGSLLRWLLPAFGALAVINLMLLGLATLNGWPAYWTAGYVAYFGLLWLANTRLAGGLFQQAAALQAALQQMQAVFGQLEKFSYRDAPRLRALCAPFLNAGQRPSRQLAGLTRTTVAAGLREHPLVWLLLNAFFPWDIFVALRLHRQRETLARHAPGWMAVWFELEALASLANLGYLNPHYTMPAISHPAQPPVLDAQRMGHPLLPDDQKVCNDFTVTALGDVAIVTGSNMAGKSTFLRTLGVNLALAYAGGPVDARGLRVGLFRLFTCIKVTDSVTNGISYFYAEVKRLRALLSALEDEAEAPLFFFIDEIFRGTNNRERFIGSRAYIKTLAGRRGVGLISTHDLELARLAEQLPAISNYHFKDDINHNQMIFDYTLRPGPCPTTNALKIMAIEGLPTE